jgi:hypothetical protein
LIDKFGACNGSIFMNPLNHQYLLAKVKENWNNQNHKNLSINALKQFLAVKKTKQNFNECAELQGNCLIMGQRMNWIWRLNKKSEFAYLELFKPCQVIRPAAKPVFSLSFPVRSIQSNLPLSFWIAFSDSLPV